MADRAIARAKQAEDRAVAQATSSSNPHQLVTYAGDGGVAGRHVFQFETALSMRPTVAADVRALLLVGCIPAAELIQ